MTHPFPKALPGSVQEIMAASNRVSGPPLKIAVQSLEPTAARSAGWRRSGGGLAQLCPRMRRFLAIRRMNWGEPKKKPRCRSSGVFEHTKENGWCRPA
jgi:hypothetical protein